MKEFELPPIELRQLFYFIAIAERGSISAAATGLGLAQPSLSEYISRLEQNLDIQLIIRSPRGIHLTEAGMALADHARELLRSAGAAVEDVRQRGGDARGSASICLSPSIGMLASVPLAETIQVEHPAIRLHIGEAMSGDIEQQVSSEKMDMGCVYEKSEGTLLSARPILIEDFFLVTARDNWRTPIGRNGRAEKPITMAELQSLPLVLPSRRHGCRDLMDRAARASGIRLNVTAEIDSLTHLLAMVDRASAYSILTHAAVFNQVKAGSLGMVEIVNPTIRRTVYLIRKRSRPISRASLVVENTFTLIVRELLARYNLQAKMPCEDLELV
jgi:LysR family transcriptional regulator, nitrogen assimilation regulatory protein